MSNQGRPNHARLTFRLPTQLKETIEKAAVLTGQSVSGFAISTLARTARDVIEQESVTRLSNRDRNVFISLLDDKEIRPNEAPAAAAMKHISRRRCR
ncbi:MAG: DUF1778 domain-containing protein [Thermoguttaceae bacterium]|jgi:uncharacterized protein (DUF1778 family)